MRQRVPYALGRERATSAATRLAIGNSPRPVRPCAAVSRAAQGARRRRGFGHQSARLDARVGRDGSRPRPSAWRSTGSSRHAPANEASRSSRRRADAGSRSNVRRGVGGELIEHLSCAGGFLDAAPASPRARRPARADDAERVRGGRTSCTGSAGGRGSTRATCAGTTRPPCASCSTATASTSSRSGTCAPDARPMRVDSLAGAVVGAPRISPRTPSRGGDALGLDGPRRTTADGGARPTDVSPPMVRRDRRR